MAPRGLPVLDPRLRCGSRLADAKPSGQVLAFEHDVTVPTLLPTRHHPWPSLTAAARPPGRQRVFAALAGYARHRPDTELARWWPQQRCRATWGRLIQPHGSATGANTTRGSASCWNATATNSPPAT